MMAGGEFMELRKRTRYLEQLIAFQDTDLVKVVTGIRRCGKSSLLELMEAHLRDSGVTEAQIIAMNFESMQYADMDSKSLYQTVMKRKLEGKRLYLFFDEIKGPPVAECDQFISSRLGLRHLCDRLQCLFALIRVVHLPVRTVCGGEDAAPLLR